MLFFGWENDKFKSCKQWNHTSSMRSKHTILSKFGVFDVDTLRWSHFFQKVAKKCKKLSLSRKHMKNHEFEIILRRVPHFRVLLRLKLNLFWERFPNSIDHFGKLILSTFETETDLFWERFLNSIDHFGKLIMRLFWERFLTCRSRDYVSHSLHKQDPVPITFITF